MVFFTKVAKSASESPAKNIADLKAKQAQLVQKNLEGYISNQILQDQLELLDIALRDACATLSSLPEATQTSKGLDGLLEFAETFMRRPSFAWEKAAYQEKIKLQWFAFPKGLVFDGINCQTTEICLLFKVKRLIDAALSSRVEMRSNLLNRIKDYVAKFWEFYQQSSSLKQLLTET